MESKISVIIPCYNVSSYVNKCVDSVLSNTYKNIEVILINDGSSDNTGELIDQYINKDCRVTVLHQENKGLSETRNIGIKKASGNYIAFIDSDDWVDVNYFETMLSFFYKNRDLVITSYNRVYKNTLVPRNLNIEGEIESLQIKRRIIGLQGEELKDPSQADSLVTIWAKLYKTSIIKSKDIRFNEVEEVGTAEDLLFNLDYLSRCNSVSFVVNCPLYYYRKDNVSSFTKRYKKNLFIKWQTLFSYIKKYAQSDEEKQALQNRICLSVIGLGLNELANPKGFCKQRDNLNIYLSSPSYIESYNNLKLSYFPLHWRLFFFFAKEKMILPIILMLKAVNYLINRNNK